MLKSVSLKNFTTLPNGKLVFSPALNVVISENGCGKSHLLKVIYSLLSVNASLQGEPTKSSLQKLYAEKLMNVFRADSLGRLVKRKQGRARCELALYMQDSGQSCAVSFATQASSSVQVDKLVSIRPPKTPVFLPTRELLTLCPWFISLYDNYHLKFEETWRDTCSLLGAPSVKGAREKQVAEMLKPLEEAMGGKVVLSPSGEFYLQIQGEGRVEAPLIAEGVRKLAMLARLISTGVLLEKGFLFWDEPEANLNPRLIKLIARSIVTLAQHGIQVFIASHSYFLLKEIQIITHDTHLPSRYFSLVKCDDGIAVEAGDSLDDIEHFVAMDEEIEQFEREQQVLGS